MTPLDQFNPQYVLIPAGKKHPETKGWPDIHPTAEQVREHLGAGGNLGFRPGSASGDIVDVDIDCREALTLKERYLPPTPAAFGHASNPLSHGLYKASGAVFAAYADPTDGSTLIELRADGRTGGAHCTLLPPSVADGEQRKWNSHIIEPAPLNAAVLARRVAWLAIGALTQRHVSAYAACRPGPDLADLLWEADPALGRAAFRWLGRPAPDEPRRHPKPRNQMTNEELRLAEVVGAITNNFDWHAWNRLGMAIFAASGGSGEGYTAFDDLSSRSPKYDRYQVLERWANYRRSPPTRIGIGSIVHLARECGWHKGRAA